MMEGIDFAAPALKIFYTCATVLCMKTMMMSVLTADLRFKKRVFLSPEDKVFKNGQVSYNNQEIERIRRAHRNDLENILPFITTGFLYSLIKPNPIIASLLYIIYTLSRLGHTYVYAVKVIPQPARFLCFTIAYVINLYMAGSIIYHIGIVISTFAENVLPLKSSLGTASQGLQSFFNMDKCDEPKSPWNTLEIKLVRKTKLSLRI